VKFDRHRDPPFLSFGFSADEWAVSIAAIAAPIKRHSSVPRGFRLGEGTDTEQNGINDF
jgi:hypothetical protein